MNVATYGPGGRFAMTDRGRTALRQSPRRLQIGPSSMTWKGGELIIEVNEIGGLPKVGRVRGQIRVTPSAITRVEMPLTDDGAHVWRPFAPAARVSCDLEAPGWQWDGHGYFDANFGTRALEADFATWTWGRFPTETGATCFYDAMRRDGTRLHSATRFEGDGTASEDATLPPLLPMRRSAWAVRRETRGDAGTRPRQVLPMLDAPFYCRAAVETTLDGFKTIGVHEALDLRRFRSPLLKPMLAVRVPRRPGWNFGL
jgi:carotenoid 1,2-hydratase